MPPATAMPSGRRSSAPLPLPNASGNAANAAVTVIASIGRNPARQPATIASEGKRRSWRSLRNAASTIMIALFEEMPTSTTIPTKATKDSSRLQASSASPPLSPANGNTAITVRGWA